MKKILFIILLFTICLFRIEAAPFKIGEDEYNTLKEAVAAVPTDGTKTTIEMTEDVTLAPGLQIVSGQNIVIDFGGHTYETWEPMIGSKGTETQSFQILKGATVYMKNGKLIASTHPNSKMFIQNYADLTVEDITIDASTNTYNYFYGISSNNGKVNIIGNTSIKVNSSTHARAFDMCWAPNRTYVDGTQIVVDTTGTMNGIIELDVWGGQSTLPILSTLTIKNINFTGTWEIDNYLANQLVIEGGKYTKTNTIDLDNFIKAGNIAYTVDDNIYEVLPSGKLVIEEEKIYVQKGEKYKLNATITEGYEKYVKYTSSNDNIATINNGTITAVSTGDTIINYSFGRLGGSVEVVVYELKQDEESIKDNENKLESIASEIINNILNDNNQEGIDKETKDKVKAAILEGKTITTNVDVKEIQKEDLDSKVLTKIENLAKKVDGELKGFIDINVLLKADNEKLGKITKLTDTIKLTIDVDKTFGEIPENTDRTYFVIRLHDGEEPEVLEAKYVDGKLTFETDRFSSYAYGYTDKNENIPNTSDNMMLYIMLVLLAMLGTGLTIVLSKKVKKLM